MAAGKEEEEVFKDSVESTPTGSHVHDLVQIFNDGSNDNNNNNNNNDDDDDDIVDGSSDNTENDFALEEGENWLRLVDRSHTTGNLALDNTQDMTTPERARLPYPVLLQPGSIDDAPTQNCYICLDVDGPLVAVKDMRSPFCASNNNNHETDEHDDVHNELEIFLARKKCDETALAETTKRTEGKTTHSGFPSSWRHYGDFERLPRRQLRVLRNGDRICTRLPSASPKDKNIRNLPHSEIGLILEYRYSDGGRSSWNRRCGLERAIAGEVDDSIENQVDDEIALTQPVSDVEDDLVDASEEARKEFFRRSRQQEANRASDNAVVTALNGLTQNTHIEEAESESFQQDKVLGSPFEALRKAAEKLPFVIATKTTDDIVSTTVMGQNSSTSEARKELGNNTAQQKSQGELEGRIHETNGAVLKIANSSREGSEETTKLIPVLTTQPSSSNNDAVDSDDETTFHQSESDAAHVAASSSPKDKPALDSDCRAETLTESQTCSLDAPTQEYIPPIHSKLIAKNSVHRLPDLIEIAKPSVPNNFLSEQRCGMRTNLSQDAAHILSSLQDMHKNQSLLSKVPPSANGECCDKSVRDSKSNTNGISDVDTSTCAATATSIASKGPSETHDHDKAQLDIKDGRDGCESYAKVDEDGTKHSTTKQVSATFVCEIEDSQQTVAMMDEENEGVRPFDDSYVSRTSDITLITTSNLNASDNKAPQSNGNKKRDSKTISAESNMMTLIANNKSDETRLSVTPPHEDAKKERLLDAPNDIPQTGLHTVATTLKKGRQSQERARWTASKDPPTPNPKNSQSVKSEATTSQDELGDASLAATPNSRESCRNKRSKRSSSQSTTSTSTSKRARVRSPSSQSASSQRVPLLDTFDIRVVVTNVHLTPSQKKMIERIGGVLLEDVQDALRATHVIAAEGKSETNEDDEPSFKRTSKLMIGMCCTENVVHLDWLIKSAKARQALAVNEFLLLKDRAAEKRYNFNMRETLRRRKEMRLNEKSLLDGWGIYVCAGVANNKAPPLQELNLIVEAAGGRWLASPSDPVWDVARMVIITSDPETKKQVTAKAVSVALKLGVPKFPVSWLFDCIMRQQLLI